MNKRNYKREEESLTQTAARLEIGIYNCVPATVVTILSVQSQFCVLEHTRHILGSRNSVFGVAGKKEVWCSVFLKILPHLNLT